MSKVALVAAGAILFAVNSFWVVPLGFLIVPFLVLVYVIRGKLLRAPGPKAYEVPSPASFSDYSKLAPNAIRSPDPTATLPIRTSQIGLAAEKPVTILSVMQEAVQRFPDAPALRYERAGGWASTTFSDYEKLIRRVARGMIHLGVEPSGAVAVMGFNSPEWFAAFWGSIYCGAKSAGIYTTNGPEACQYIINHSESRVVFVDEQHQLDKILSIAEGIASVAAVVYWGADVRPPQNPPITVLSWESFLATANKTPMDEVEKRMAAQKPGNVASLIYTSGTTGDPKAVMVTHDNLAWTSKALLTACPDFGLATGPEALISYLPLSHIAAQIVDCIVPIVVAATRAHPAVVSFARPDALKGTLGLTLQAVQPTFFFGVPRVWEKFQERMKEAGKSSKGLKKKLVLWAKRVGLEACKRGSVGGDGTRPLGYQLANALVFSKVKQKLGFTRCRYFATGAAPISMDTLEFFAALDMPIMECFGMSECCGPHSVTSYQYLRLGSVGVALDGTEVRIDHQAGRDKPGEGEIVMRGRHVMVGYMNNASKTRETIDDQGWLHSGDVGRLDADGFLYITGRIKELLITAGGENVAPVPIEQRVKAACPALSNVVLIGDKRKFLSLLVTVKVEMAEDGTPTNRLTAEALDVSPGCKTVEGACDDGNWKAYIDSGIAEANKHAPSNAQYIRKWAMLREDFSVPGGQLTSTLKLKRPVVSQLCAKDIEAMYS